MKKLNLFQCSVFLLFLSVSVFAFNVNTVNGGGSVTYVDFNLEGQAVPLQLVRTFNTITATSEVSGWSGAFGWGWTSDFETTLTVTPERDVLLRDGGTGNTIRFKPQKENPKELSAFYDKMKRGYFERSLNRKISDSELKNLKWPDNLLNKLKNDPKFRLQLASRYGVEGDVPSGELLVSTQYGFESLQFKEGLWEREKDGVLQYFDGEGRVIRLGDRNGYFFDYVYKNANNKLEVSEIQAKDKAVSLKFQWKEGRIASIIDNKGNKAVYSYDKKGNLISAVDSSGQKFNYQYENAKFPHLLTAIKYDDQNPLGSGGQRTIKYDENGLVVSHEDRDGSLTTYQYGKQPRDPENNFWTKITFVKLPSYYQPGSMPEEIYEEFFLQKRPDGSKYLYKTETKKTFKVDNQKKVDTELITFTACCGKPSQIVRNGKTTTFKYYANGLLKERFGDKEALKLEYDPKWLRVSRVERNGKVTTFDYDNKGNVSKVATNASQLSIRYDAQGRIAKMVQNKGKAQDLMNFAYGGAGKPTLIEVEKIGSLKISYDKEGRIKERIIAKANQKRKLSSADSEKIERTVMETFRGMLKMIRPAGLVNDQLSGEDIDAN